MSGRLSAVDRSPFHSRYVRERLKPRQRDEVRILKQFLKGIGCYGAETATGGFSGYLAELLVLRLGSFWETLLTLRDREPPIRLSLEGSPEALGGDLVFVDPVDASRNAAAAVTRERLEAFLRAARAFTQGPDLRFFWPRPVRPAKRASLVERLGNRGVLGLELPPPKVREQAIEPHARRFSDKVARHLEAAGFRVVRRALERLGPRRLLALWELDPVVLPETYEHAGPPTDAADHSRRFLQKWQAHPDATELPHPSGGRWRVTLRRRRRTPKEVLKPHMRQLMKGLELTTPQRKRVRLFAGPECTRASGAETALTKFLDPRDPWDR